MPTTGLMQVMLKHYEQTEAEYTLVAQLELPRGDFSTVNGRYCAKELNLFIKDD